MTQLIVAGIAAQGAGYPNAKQTLAALTREGWHIEDHASWLSPDTHLWRLARGSMFGRVIAAARYGWLGLIQVGQRVFRGEKGALLYVPYPAPLFLCWLSLVPKRFHPRCIADAYISIWDSMFRDRAPTQRASNFSKLVRYFESSALRHAAMVLVDSESNRRMFVAELGIDEDKIRSLPLAIQEEPFLGVCDLCSTAPNRRVRILFVGTLIPLHGVEIMLEAFEDLGGGDNFEVRIVGNGQEASKVEAFLASRPRSALPITWIRDWQPIGRIADEVAEADICLGIFGGAGKAERVLPLKVYSYLAAGRAVIMQSRFSLPEGCPELPVLHADSATGLVNALRRLAADPELRAHLGAGGRKYYMDWLCNRRVAECWRQVLKQLDAGSA